MGKGTSVCSVGRALIPKVSESYASMVTICLYSGHGYQRAVLDSARQLPGLAQLPGSHCQWQLNTNYAIVWQTLHTGCAAAGICGSSSSPCRASGESACMPRPPLSGPFGSTACQTLSQSGAGSDVHSVYQFEHQQIVRPHHYALQGSAHEFLLPSVWTPATEWPKQQPPLL